MRKFKAWDISSEKLVLLIRRRMQKYFDPLIYLYDVIHSLKVDYLFVGCGGVMRNVDRGTRASRSHGPLYDLYTQERRCISVRCIQFAE